jgi:hypothetical protein
MKLVARALSIAAFFGGMAVLHAMPPAPDGTSGDAKADSKDAKPALTTSEMTTKSAAIHVEIGQDNQKVLALKEKARKLKDVIKLNCVNDKQIQVKAEMNIADSANEQLQGALGKGGADAQGPFAQLESAGNAIHGLTEAAAACIGEDMFKQEVGGSVDAPPIVDDPTAPTDPFAGYELEPPVSASK